MDYKERNHRKDELFNIIKEDINMNIDKLYIIIASFYYLLFYKFKDIKKIKGRTNIGNVYINIILKNFILFLAQRFDNLNKNLIDLLHKLYFFDLINSNIYKNSEKTIEAYSLDDIDNLISSKCGSNLKDRFEKDKKNYENAIEKEINFFTILGKKIDENLLLKDFSLTGIDKKVFSNTITIIIDMFSKEDEINEWVKFMNYFDKKTMFYFLKWTHSSKKYLLKNVNPEIISNYKKISKFAGILLADILISNIFFNDFQINLIGFSLGANVVKYCIKKLSKLNNKKNYVKLKNVILIGGATHIKHEDKWREHIKNTIIDRFINCYSGYDNILNDFYFINSKYVNELGKCPIGIDCIELKDDDGVNLVRNFDFTEDNYDQLSYEFENIAKKIFSNYKDL